MNRGPVSSFDEPAEIIARNDAPEDIYIPGYCGVSWKEKHLSKKAIKQAVADWFPSKSDTTGNIVRKLIRAVSSVVLIGCIVFFGVYYHDYRVRALQASSLNDLLNEEPVGLPGDPELEKAWNNIREQYPLVNFPEGMDIRFAELYAINDHVTGKLTIPNTNIETYVMLHPKDNYYYLNRDFYKKTSRYGQAFADNRCKITADGNSKNIIIYGHNTHDGLMFNQLEKYMTVEGFINAPIINFDTLYGSAKYKIFAVMLTNSTPDADNGNLFDYLYTDFESDEAFATLMSQVYSRSMIHTGVDLTVEDEVLTLYTCYQEIFRGGRLVVFARKLRAGESPAIDPTQVYFDTAAKFPQAYRNKTGR